MRETSRSAIMYLVLSLWALFALACLVLDALPFTLLPLPRAWQSTLPRSWHFDFREIMIFYHAAQIGPWELIMREQLAHLVQCGLYGKCSKIALGFLGDPGVLREFLCAYSKIDLVYTGDDTGEHEAPTLMKAHEYCTENRHKDVAILYFHTKGVTTKRKMRNGVEVKGQEAWRRMMEYWVFGRHDLCLARLRGGYLTCGAYMHYDHYCGNFWWAQSRYLRTLDPPQLVVAQKLPRRLSELWVLSKRQKGRHLSLAVDAQEVERKGSLYNREIQEEEYTTLRETFV